MSKVYTIKDKKSNQWSSVCCRTRVKGILVIIVILNVYIQLSNVYALSHFIILLIWVMFHPL